MWASFLPKRPLSIFHYSYKVRYRSALSITDKRLLPLYNIGQIYSMEQHIETDKRTQFIQFLNILQSFDRILDEQCSDANKHISEQNKNK